MTRRLVVAISGASGLMLGKELLACLASPEAQSAGGLETHLIISEGARRVALHESADGPAALRELSALAHAEYDPADFSAPMASGSWRHAGMAVCPCSMSSLAAIAHGHGTTLIHRAADVCLKERRPLVLVPRETPLSRVHLANMLAAHEAGAIIMPPNPAYYAGVETLTEAARHFCARILDQLGIPSPAITRWKE